MLPGNNLYHLGKPLLRKITLGGSVMQLNDQLPIILRVTRLTKVQKLFDLIKPYFSAHTINLKNFRL